jgi:hypothetical protein
VSRIINTTINGTLSLLPTDNPLTITASGGVSATATGADAIDGDSSTAWAISNAGTISSASGYGVSLLGAGSSVTNYPGGSISGTGPTSFNFISGVSIGGSGTVTIGRTISVSGGVSKLRLPDAADPRDGVRLIRAFLEIKEPAWREKLIHLAEDLARASSDCLGTAEVEENHKRAFRGFDVLANPR